jgi:two-component system, NarL family, nitrate/nitrite response regulator NarL
VTRVVVVAEIRLYREGLADMLRGEPGMDVAATASGVDEAVRALREHEPDVVLIDMAIPDNAWVVRGLVAAVPGTRVVALAVPEVEREVLACAEAGVAGYVPREGSADELVDTLRHAVRGEALCSPAIVGTLFRQVAALATDRRPRTAVGRLTARERQIMQLVDRGLTNREIASRLGIELSTVKNHIHNILDKLQVRRRAEAAAMALEQAGGWR